MAGPVEDFQGLGASERILKEFLEFRQLGLREKAKAAATALVEALPSPAEKDAWTREHLEKLPLSGRGCIQHEIYEGIVFPSLCERYAKGDPEASYLFGVFWQNYATAKEFTEQIGFQTVAEFLERAYRSDTGSERYRLAFLNALNEEFNYLFHEWPSGILIDHDDWANELFELRNRIELAHSLDREGRHTQSFKEMKELIRIYHRKLSDRDAQKTQDDTR